MIELKIFKFCDQLIYIYLQIIILKTLINAFNKIFQNMTENYIT